MQIRALSGICWGVAFIVDQRSKIKPSKSLVMTLRRFLYIASTGYQHHCIPDGLSNVSRKISQLVLNVSMPEVWTCDIPSRHLIPWADKFIQLFILLCCIVNFISFDSINSTKLWFFLRTSKFLYKTPVVLDNTNLLFIFLAIKSIHIS